MRTRISQVSLFSLVLIAFVSLDLRVKPILVLEDYVGAFATCS